MEKRNQHPKQQRVSPETLAVIRRILDADPLAGEGEIADFEAWASADFSYKSPHPSIQKALLNASEAAELLGMSRSSFYHVLENPDTPSRELLAPVPIGKSGYRYSRERLQRWARTVSTDFAPATRNGTRLRAPSKSKSLSKSGIGCYKILLGRYIRIIDFDPDFDFDPDYLLIRVPLPATRGRSGGRPLKTEKHGKKSK